MLVYFFREWHRITWILLRDLFQVKKFAFWDWRYCNPDQRPLFRQWPCRYMVFLRDYWTGISWDSMSRSVFPFFYSLFLRSRCALWVNCFLIWCYWWCTYNCSFYPRWGSVRSCSGRGWCLIERYCDSSRFIPSGVACFWCDGSTAVALLWICCCFDGGLIRESSIDFPFRRKILYSFHSLSLTHTFTIELAYLPFSSLLFNLYLVFLHF